MKQIYEKFQFPSNSFPIFFTVKLQSIVTRLQSLKLVTPKIISLAQIVTPFFALTKIQLFGYGKDFGDNRLSFFNIESLNTHFFYFRKKIYAGLNLRYFCQFLVLYFGNYFSNFQQKIYCKYQKHFLNYPNSHNHLNSHINSNNHTF